MSLYERTFRRIMTAKDKKDPYKEVAESLDLEENGDRHTFDSDIRADGVSLGDSLPDSEDSARVDLESDKRIAELSELVTIEKDKTLRLQAEVENIRKRAGNDVASARKYAIESFASNLLPVIDSLETALSTENQTNDQLEDGVKLTLKQLKQAFERANVEEVHPEVGEKFDPNWHQAVSTKSLDETEQDLDSGVVFEVLQKGYKISGRVIRPAVVIVTG